MKDIFIVPLRNVWVQIVYLYLATTFAKHIQPALFQLLLTELYLVSIMKLLRLSRPSSK